MKTFALLTLLLSSSLSFAELKVGNSVYAVNGERAYTEARIIDVDTNGLFTVKFISDGASGGNWGPGDLAATKGCSADLCVGNTVYPTDNARAWTSAIVVGIEPSGNYILEFNSDLGVGGGWSRSSLAVIKGCSSEVCVGSNVYTIDSDRAWTPASVIAIDPQGLLVLKFTADNAIGGNWSRTSLALTEGCAEELCVGDKVIPTEVVRVGSIAEIVAIDANGQYVLKFDEDAAVGGQWTRNLLAKASGCSASGVCVGQSVVAASGAREGTSARIIGFDSAEKFILKFDVDGAVGAGWTRNDFNMAE